MRCSIKAYNAMYNLRFDEAFRLAESAKRMANDDPVPWMAQACAVLFREFDHMHILRSELFSAPMTSSLTGRH